MEERLFICTDLDRTLLPNGKQPASQGSLELFTKLTTNAEITLAYVSGRHRALVEEAIEEYQLPYPALVVADVGSTIYQITDRQWQIDHHWTQTIAPDWQGKSSKDLVQLFNDIPDLQLQEGDKQSEYKLSYYVTMNTDIALLKQELDKRLSERNIHASIIDSVDEMAEVGLLDILPQQATKLQAIKYLMDQYGFNNTDTVFAGDSGNDIPVFVSDIASVVVANADQSVKTQAIQLAKQQEITTSLYLATGGFLGMNGNYSAGILEGIAHFHPAIKNWLEQNYHVSKQ